MSYSFLPPARAELQEAVDYLDSCRTGLGAEFAAEVRRTIDTIVLQPRVWAKISKNTRRCRLRVFKYAVLYQIREGDEVLIVAVAHLRRDPMYWRNRIDP